MNIEFAILDFINETFSCAFMDYAMRFFTFLADGGWFWIVLGVTLSIVPKTRKIGFSLCLALILNLLICNLTLKPIIARTRPYDLIEGIELIITRPTDFSFPSGHTSASFAAAVALFANNKKYGLMAIGLAFMIAFSRLYFYVHFPTDILGGILVGSFCAFMSYYVLKLIFQKVEKKKEL